MLKVIFNMLNLLAEESTAEKTGSVQSREKHPRSNLQPQNHVWKVHPTITKSVPCLLRFQDSLWQGLACSWMGTMKKYNITANLICTTEQLYDKATSAVPMNSSIGKWFRTTVGFTQECLLSPILFNTFFFSNRSRLMLWKNMMESK